MFENGTYQWRNPEGKRVSIAISGDICPVCGPDEAILQGKTREILAGIQPALDKADLRLAQWETAISDQPAPIIKAGPALAVKPGCEAFLTEGHFEVALLANNHTGDHGPSNEIATINCLHAAGIKTVGAGATELEARQPLHLEKNGVAISILNFCETEFGTSWEDHAGTNAMDELENMLQIAEERKTYEVVLVIIHGGNEHNPIPSPRMKKLYRAFAKAGASAVVNIHTHCPQGIEVVDGVPIIYCPGNFFFPSIKPLDYADFWWSGYLPRISFDANGAFEIEITPYKISNAPYSVTALEGTQRQWYLDYVEKISAILKTEAEHWFDIWCAYKYTLPLLFVKLAKPQELTDNPEDPEALKALPFVRHMVTCQAHNELSKRVFLLLERKKIKALQAEIPKLDDLRTARFNDL